MWGAVPMIATPIALVAFAVAVVSVILRARNNRARELIETAPEDERAELVRHALETYSIRDDDLAPEQKFQLVAKVIEARAARFRLVTICSVVVATIFAAVVIAIVLFGESSDVVVDDHEPVTPTETDPTPAENDPTPGETRPDDLLAERQEAVREDAAAWVAAWNGKKLNTLIQLSQTPFFFDDKLYEDADAVGAALNAAMQNTGGTPHVEHESQPAERRLSEMRLAPGDSPVPLLGGLALDSPILPEIRERGTIAVEYVKVERYWADLSDDMVLELGDFKVYLPSMTVHTIAELKELGHLSKFPADPAVAALRLQDEEFGVLHQMGSIKMLFLFRSDDVRLELAGVLD